MDGSLIIFLIAILIVGILVFLAIAMTSKHGHVFDKENYQVEKTRQVTAWLLLKATKFSTAP